MEPIKIERLGEVTGSQTVEIPMTAAERRLNRRRLMAPGGQEILLALPTGTVLQPGQALVAVGATVYRVSAAPEELLLIYPQNLEQAARIGHLVGNLHRELDFYPDHLAALYEEVLAARLAKMVRVERGQGPFLSRAPGEHSH